MNTEEKELWEQFKRLAKRDLTEYGALNYGRITEAMINMLPEQEKLGKLRGIVMYGFPVPLSVKRELEAGGIRRMEPK